MTQNGTDTLPLVVVGYDFRRASAQWRSQLVLSLTEQDELAERLRVACMIDGLAVLNTCNRNEWIASTESPAWTGDILRAQMMRLLTPDPDGGQLPEPYIYIGEEAVRHIVHVAAGLKSFVVGEHQIASQLNRALVDAQEHGRSSSILNGLAPICGRASRDSLLSGLGDCSLRGVHDAALRCLIDKYDTEDNRRVVVVGTGEVGRRVVDSMRYRTKWRVTPCNRTIRQGAMDVRPLTDLPQLLVESDMAVVCTGAFRKVLTPDLLADLPEDHELTIVDLGIPTQVHPDCGLQPNISLVDLDGLQASVEIDTDPQEMGTLMDELENLVADFSRYCRERDFVQVMKTTQSLHERFIHEAVPSLLNEELPNLPETERKRLVFRLRGLFREYTNSIFDSIHQTAMEKTDD